MTLRSLPSVDRLAAVLPDELPRVVANAIARRAIAEARDAYQRDPESPIDPKARAEGDAAAWLRRRPLRVINATGVLLHTNLGRAPLDPSAVEAAMTAASHYTNLEIDLEDGRRGSRLLHVESQLRELTGAGAALVVNNNAAALLLTLMVLASGRTVPVSRGEMIEIGGSYRLPDLMAASGARMVEVGTTNRTRVGDHAQAIDADAALFLKIHPSNYRVTGFTAEASIAELVALGRSHELPVVFDLGSGLLDERVPWIPGPPPSWLQHEPGVVQSLEAGVDIVTFSGDKLLGGPQAGIIVGRPDLVERLRNHPMTRALRVDAPTIGMLVATLDRYLEGSAADLPLWRMATVGSSTLRHRAEEIIRTVTVRDATVQQSTATMGAGSVPGATFESVAIVLEDDADRRHAALLRHDPPVVGRRSAGALLLDLRTIDPRDDALVAEALNTRCR